MLLAFGAATLADGPLERFASATIVDRDALQGDLEAARERGYSTLVDELEDGLSAVGAPVRDRGGAVVAAITLAGATLRLPAARLRAARAPRGRAGRRAVGAARRAAA